MKRLTIGELRDFCVKWQERLGLSDWKITVRYAKKDEMDQDAYDGHASWVPEFPEAIILLSRKIRPDHEKEVVLHELLHVRFEGHQPAPRDYEIGYERAINVIVDVLLKGIYE